MSISELTTGISETGSITVNVITANQYVTPPGTIQAAGTAQATASVINANVGLVRLQGVTDGQATGFKLPNPGSLVGTEQTLIYEGAVSANLWPDSGCSINLTTANTVFALAPKTPYYVTYVTTSAYSVK